MRTDEADIEGDVEMLSVWELIAAGLVPGLDIILGKSMLGAWGGGSPYCGAPEVHPYQEECLPPEATPCVSCPASLCSSAYKGSCNL